MNYPFYKKLGYVGIRQDKDLVFFKKDRNNNYDKTMVTTNREA